jgi:transposase
MEVLHPRCAGLDGRKDSVVAAVRIAGPDGGSVQVRRFDTTPGLLALGEWLAAAGVTEAVTEASGVSWKPIWQVLSDGELSLVLANAAHVKNVPGRKTDVADAAWLAEVLAHGLIRPSFVPDAPTRARRALLRTRKQTVREQASHVQRIRKVLEDANLRLGSVLSRVVGATGRAILQARIAGETDPDRLLALVTDRVKAEPARLRGALTGRLTDRHRFLLRLRLGQHDALAKALEAIDTDVERDPGPFRHAVRLLRSIPGVSDLSAEVIVAEIGSGDRRSATGHMSRFPIAGHLIAWAGLWPRNDESAGNRRSTRLRKGTPWLKTTLVRRPWAARRTRPRHTPTSTRDRQNSTQGPSPSKSPSSVSTVPDAHQ